MKHKLFWSIIIITAVVLIGLVILRSATIKQKIEFLRLPSATSSISQNENVATSSVVSTKLFEYIKIIESCGVHYEGVCVNARSGPGKNFPVVAKLRNNIVLKVEDKVEKDGKVWYKITFDEWLRYPERISSDWYVAEDFVQLLKNEGVQQLTRGLVATSTKYIIVSRGEQMLYAYDGDTLFMKEKISTGLELTPTPRGTFIIYKKTPSRYMQGPIPGISEEIYDLPGVPWDLYFSSDGAVIHGAYWHNDFGKVHSNGCVNLPPMTAEKLYEWADLGMQVVVKD